MVEMDVIPACEAYGVGVIPWSPLGGGLLGGVLKKIEADQSRRADAGMQARVEAQRGQIEQYEAFCDDLGEKPADVALAWLLKNPVVTAPIIGPRTIDQLTGSFRALAIDLDDAAMTRLDEIWPGYQTSPEHYAW
jgi:aryl-alcohol dehydrogenase-like predicted oxidoreductase